MKLRNVESFESLIGAAMLAESTEEKAAYLRRYECRARASQEIACSCGAIHDMKKIQLLVNETGATCAACCPDCRVKNMKKMEPQRGEIRITLAGWTWQNWNGVEELYPGKE